MAASSGGSSGGGGGGGAQGEPPSNPLDNTYDDLNILKGDLADSTAGFLFKLLCLSFLGGAIIKYGSMVVALPHEPNVAVATAMVFLPPAVWAAWALAKSPR